MLTRLGAAALLAACAPDPSTSPRDLAAPPIDPDAAAVIYGQDDRAEAYEITDASLRAAGDATAAIFDATSLVFSSTDNTWIIDQSTRLRDLYRPLCPNEPYADQPTAAMCTGFLVGPQTLVTAGHCITTTSCPHLRFGFGYALDAPGQVPARLPTQDVYRCSAVIERHMSGQEDYAVVVLDRPVRDREPLVVRAEEGAAPVGTPLVLIGHPVGLPLKFAPNAEVMSITPLTLEASLDAYGGNSGSPVLDAVTLEVVGLLASGQQDFTMSGQCFTSNVCSRTEGCPGFESVTRADLWGPAALGERVERNQGANVICDGVSCRTTPRPLAHDARATTTWEPCGDGHFLWEAEGQFEAGYDRGCVDGRASAGAAGGCRADAIANAADRPAIELRGAGPWRGVAQGQVRLSVATDGSVESQGITQIAATCLDGPPDLAAIGRLTPPAGQGCASVGGGSRPTLVGVGLLILGLTARRRRGSGAARAS